LYQYKVLTYRYHLGPEYSFVDQEAIPLSLAENEVYGTVFDQVVEQDKIVEAAFEVLQTANTAMTVDDTACAGAVEIQVERGPESRLAELEEKVDEAMVEYLRLCRSFREVVLDITRRILEENHIQFDD